MALDCELHTLIHTLPLEVLLPLIVVIPSEFDIKISAINANFWKSQKTCHTHTISKLLKDFTSWQKTAHLPLSLLPLYPVNDSLVFPTPTFFIFFPKNLSIMVGLLVDMFYLPLTHERTNCACISVSGEERCEMGSFWRSVLSKSRAASPTPIPWRAR